METTMVYSPDSKHLCYRVRQRVTADLGLAIRGNGMLNTTTGAFDYKAMLSKFVTTGPEVKGDANQPLKLGIGLGVSSATNHEPFLVVSARKSLPILEGNNTVVTAKAAAELDPQRQQLGRRVASVRVSRTIMNFTERQDLRLTAGLDLDWAKAKPQPQPFVKLRENNWGLNWRNNRWHVTYDL